MSANAIDLFAGVNVAPPASAGQLLVATGASTAAWGNSITAPTTVTGLLTTQAGITNSGAALTDSGGLVETAASSTVGLTTAGITAAGGISTTGLNNITSNVGLIANTGNVDVKQAGKGLMVAEGSNAKQGVTAAMTAGTITVANTSVTANSRIMLTGQTAGGTPGGCNVSARSAGTSFTITSTNAADTSTVGFQIFEPG